MSMWSAWHPGSNTRATAEIRKREPTARTYWTVLHADVGGEPGIEPWHSIPVQRIQVVAHRVHGVLASNDWMPRPTIPICSGNSLLLKPFTGAGIVIVRPLLCCLIAPRRRLRRDRPRRELVVSQDTVPFRSIAKRVEYITQVSQRDAVVV